jgi:hypothetical protein
MSTLRARNDRRFRRPWRRTHGTARGVGAWLRLLAYGHLLGDDPRAAARLSGADAWHIGPHVGFIEGIAEATAWFGTNTASCGALCR